MTVEEKISTAIWNAGPLDDDGNRKDLAAALNQILADELHLLRERIGMEEFAREATELANQRLTAQLDAMRRDVIRLEGLVKPPAWQCSGCGLVKRFPKWELAQPCPACKRKHYWTGSVDDKALREFDTAEVGHA